jgi:hypothetical protein
MPEVSTNVADASEELLSFRLLGRDPDPAKSGEHVQLSVLAERRLVPARPRTSPRCWRISPSRPSRGSERSS